MGEIFINQPATLFAKTETDLTDATVQVVKYKKPDDSTAS